MINIAICDDDVALTGYAEKLVFDLGQSLQQKLDVTVFFSGEELVEHISESEIIFDIILMDIEMGELSGVDAGRKLREKIEYDQTFLIYISSHNSYYREIIDLNVLCFIQKPFNITEFNLKLTKAIQKVENRLLYPQAHDFVFEKGGGKISVPIKSIMYFESELRKIHLYSTLNTYTYYSSLDNEERKLPSDLFCRIHRSNIVNFAHITQITAQTVTISGQTLNISVKYRESTKRAYARYRSG